MECTKVEEYIVPDFVGHENCSYPQIKSEPKEEDEPEIEMEFIFDPSNEADTYSNISEEKHSINTQQASENSCDKSARNFWPKDSLSVHKYPQVKRSISEENITKDEETFQVDNDDKGYNYEMVIDPEEIHNLAMPPDPIGDSPSYPNVVSNTCTLNQSQSFHVSGIQNPEVFSKKGNFGDIKRYTCKHCTKTFTADTNYLGQVPDKCGNCIEAPLKLPDNMKLHLNLHAKGEVLKLGVSEKAYLLNSHLGKYDICIDNLKKRSEVKSFKCSDCDKEFTTKYYLNKHLKLHSEGKFNPETEFLQKTHMIQASIQDSLNTRFTRNKRPIILMSLTGEKTFKCTQCEQVFPCKSDFSMHPCGLQGQMLPKTISIDNPFNDNSPRIVSKEKPMKCRYCDKIFYSRHNLSKHAKTHPEKSLHKCNYCEKAFSSIGLLNRHLNVHPEAKILKCTYCIKEFATQSNLERHLKWHPQEREQAKSAYYSKRVYTEPYTPNKNLLMIVSLSGEKLYKCIQCEKIFPQKGNFINHVCSSAVQTQQKM